MSGEKNDREIDADIRRLCRAIEMVQRLLSDLQYEYHKYTGVNYVPPIRLK